MIYNLSATSGPNSATDWFNLGPGQMISVNVGGTFVGTVLVERRRTPTGTAYPVARSLIGGDFLQFTGASGDFRLQGVEGEPDAQVRLRMTARSSGTADVDVGV